MTAQMRATHLKENLDAIQHLGAAHAARVFDRVPGTVSAIRDALRTAWLDVEHDVALTEALAVEVGNRGVRDVNAEAIRSALASPLLKSLWEGAVKLFGMTPEGVLRWTPQFWSQLYRDAGTLVFDPASRSVVAEGLPERMVASRAWLEGLAGAIQSVVELCGCHGTVIAERTGPGRAVFRLP